MEFLILDREPRAVTTARHWVVDACRRRGLDDATCDPLELVTAEMVGNAVKHGAGRIVVALGVDDPAPYLSLLTGEADHAPALVVSVTDAGSARPRPRRAGDTETSGRGLALVDALAIDWGVTAVVARAGSHGTHGKTAWALVPSVS